MDREENDSDKWRKERGEDGVTRACWTCGKRDDGICEVRLW